MPIKYYSENNKTLKIVSDSLGNEVSTVMPEGFEPPAFEDVKPKSKMSSAERAEYGRTYGFGETRKNPDVPTLLELEV